MSDRPVSMRNVGVMLAIFSGLILLASAIWPAVGLSNSAPRGTWAIALVVGLGFLASAFLADRSTAVSKIILVVGAVVLVVSAIMAGQLPGNEHGWIVPGLALLPAVLATVAAFIIGPMQRNMAP